MKARPDHTLRTTLTMLGLLGLVVATVAGAAAGLASRLDLTPQLGDIVSFDPGRPVPLDLQTAVEAERVGGGQCVLDTGFLDAHTGSLIVEGADPAHGLMRAHWAGGPTAAGAADCGREAELLLRPDAVERLAVAAGGFGVTGRKLMLASTYPNSNGML